MLEAFQGDRISGKISRKEVARIAVAALGTAASVGECSLREMKRACMHEIRAEGKGLAGKISGIRHTCLAWTPGHIEQQPSPAH